MPAASPPVTDERDTVLAIWARRFLFTLALAGVVLLLDEVIRFRSLRDHRALAWYAIAASLIAFGLRAGRARSHVRIGIALACIGAGVASLGLEWTIDASRRATFLRMQRTVEQEVGHPFDARSVPQVVMDLWKTDSDAVPSIVPSILIEYSQPATDAKSRFASDIFPLGGASKRQTVQLCNESGSYPLYHSDLHGFLNPAAAWAPAPGRLVVIGDSFTHGYCVPPDSAFPSLLRHRWPTTLNLGAGGDGPLAELATLAEYGIPAHPGVVLWVYFENDLPDLRRERQNPWLMRYLEPSFTQHLWQRQDAIDNALVPWIRRVYGGGTAPRFYAEYGVRQVVTLTAIRGLVRQAFAGKPAGSRDQLPLFRQILAEARGRVAAGGGQIVMVFLPEWERFFAPVRLVEDENRGAVLGAATGLGIPVIDLLPVFAAERDRASLFGRRDVSSAHYSSIGYALVARAIERGLDSLGLSATLTRAGAHRP